MNPLQITTRNNNIEILSKLINSVAKKYNCGVKYDPETNGLRYTGDSAFKRDILQEAMGFLGDAR